MTKMMNVLRTTDSKLDIINANADLFYQGVLLMIILSITKKTLLVDMKR